MSLQDHCRHELNCRLASGVANDLCKAVVFLDCYYHEGNNHDELNSCQFLISENTLEFAYSDISCKISTG